MVSRRWVEVREPERGPGEQKKRLERWEAGVTEHTRQEHGKENTGGLGTDCTSRLWERRGAMEEA